MDLYTLHAALRDALATDATLGAWAVAQFGKSFTVYSGTPSADRPSIDDDAPFIELGDPEDERSMLEDHIPYAFAGHIGLANKTMKSGLLANVVEPEGVQQIIDAVKLVRNAIAAAMPAGMMLEKFTSAADTLGAHDEIHGHFEFFLQEPITVDQDPLA